MRTWGKSRRLFPLLAIAVVCVLFLALWAGGRREVLLDGTYQSGFEQSAFIPDGNCSKKPFWFHWPDDYDMNARIKTLGYPAALRVKLIGNVSRLGKYGHLGAYPREVWPIKIISVDPAPPCGQGSPKPDFYDEVSQALVGQQITIRGRFLLGKIGWYIQLDNQQEVYFFPKRSSEWGSYAEMQGKLVTATDILRVFRCPKNPPTDKEGRVINKEGRVIDRCSDYFYFEGETAQVRLIGP